MEHVAIEGVDDAHEFDEMHNALEACGFTLDEQDATRIVAGILHPETSTSFPTARITQSYDIEAVNVAADMFQVEQES